MLLNCNCLLCFSLLLFFLKKQSLHGSLSFKFGPQKTLHHDEEITSRNMSVKQWVERVIQSEEKMRRKTQFDSALQPEKRTAEQFQRPSDERFAGFWLLPVPFRKPDIVLASFVADKHSWLPLFNTPFKSHLPSKNHGCSMDQYSLCPDLCHCPTTTLGGGGREERLQKWETHPRPAHRKILACSATQRRVKRSNKSPKGSRERSCGAACSASKCSLFRIIII